VLCRLVTKCSWWGDRLRNTGSPHLLYSLHFRYKFSPLSIFICKFRLLYTDDEQTFELSHSATVKLNPEGYFECTKCQKAQSQWLCCLRHRYVPARLLESWVQIPPTAWTSVSSACCVVKQRSLRWTGRLSRGVLLSVVRLRWGLHKVTLCATHQQVQLPDNEQSEWKLAMSVTCRKEKAWQWANSALVHCSTPLRSTEEF